MISKPIWNPEIAQLTRQHNDANILVMPGRFIDNKTAEAILDEFFATTFEGGRHERRVKNAISILGGATTVLLRVCAK